MLRLLVCVAAAGVGTVVIRGVTAGSVRGGRGATATRVRVGRVAGRRVGGGCARRRRPPPPTPSPSPSPSTSISISGSTATAAAAAAGARRRGRAATATLRGFLLLPEPLAACRSAAASALSCAASNASALRERVAMSWATDSSLAPSMPPAAAAPAAAAAAAEGVPAAAALRELPFLADFRMGGSGTLELPPNAEGRLPLGVRPIAAGSR